MDAVETEKESKARPQDIDNVKELRSELKWEFASWQGFWHLFSEWWGENVK